MIIKSYSNRGSQLKEIYNPLDIQKLLQEQVASGGMHQLWLKSQGKLKSYSLKMKNIDLVSQTYFVEIIHKEETARNFGLLAGVEAKLYLTGVNIIFYSEIINFEFETHTLELAFPEVVFFSERRTEERKRPMGMAKIRLPIRGELSKGLVKDVLDLSSGGLSFILHKEDYFPFEKGDEIPQAFELTYQGKKFLLRADVVQILKIKPFVLENVPYGDRLISLCFNDADQVGLKRWQSFWKSFG